ncbi:MAG TPA: toll/interleukin-1 receptor domain-containing protein [Allosphingosinicella sp.]|nr:toll/interleukin-1 receptor domain-containing protein [Allosphingosinicella sp.]
MAHDIFISHAEDDRSVAEAACAALEARGLACWLTPRDLLPGQDETGAIARAKLLVAILSAASAGKVRLQREGERAAAHGVPILVLRTADVAPGPALEGAERLDALTPPVAPHLDYLGDRAVRLIEAGRPAPGRQLTEPPRAFPRAGRSSSGWLTILAAGIAGLAAIALAAAYVNQ